LSYGDLPLPPYAFSPSERKELSFLTLAVISAGIIYVVVDAVMSQKPLQDKIPVAALGCGFILLTFALVVFLSKIEDRENQARMRTGTFMVR